MQHEPVIRLLAADIVDPAAVAEGLRAMDAEIASAVAGVEAAEEGLEARVPHRAALLRTNHRYARRLLELQREWLQDARRVLGAGAADDAPPVARD